MSTPATPIPHQPPYSGAKLATWLGTSLVGTLLLAGPAQGQAPTVAGLSPTRNALTAPRTTPVAVSFDQPLGTGTATLEALRVFSAQAGGRKAGSVAVNGNALSFLPSTGFKPGETVSGTVTRGVQSSNGQNLAAPQVFRFTTATTPSSGVFGGGTDISPGGALVVAGDADNDGDLDLFTMTSGSSGTSNNVLQISLNTGNGTAFVAAPSINVGPSVDLTLGDVDGDGDLDFVVVSSTSLPHLTVGLNNGNATFTTSTTRFFSSGLVSVALGDLDGDGDLDLVAGDNEAVGVGIGLNNGQGVFTLSSAVSAPTGLGLLTALGDVDNDGDLDLLIAGTRTSAVSVRLNNGAGSFSGSQQVAVGGGPSGLAVGDVDGDGDLDLFTLNTATSTVSVRLNNGAGFLGTQNVAVGNRPTSLAVGDVDGDGDLDIVAANTSNTASVRLNDGNGLFAGNQEVAAGVGSRGVALGDLDGDGDLDLAVTNSTSNTTSIRLNQNQASPAPTITSLSTPTGSAGNRVVINGTNFLSVTQVTFNGVPAAELTLTSLTQLAVVVPAGVSTGPVVVTTAFGPSNGVLFTVVPPVLVTGVVPTRNAPAASPATPVAVTVDQPLNPGVATQSTLKVFGSLAGGRKTGTTTVGGNTLTFVPNTAFKPGETVYASVSSEAQSATGGTVKPHVFQFTTATTPSSGTFSAGTDLTIGGSAPNMAVGDVDGDGDLDLATATTIRLNNGNGTFVDHQNLPGSNYSDPRGVALGDVDGDGDLDLLVANSGSNTVSVRLNNGAGTFGSIAQAAVDSSPFRAVLGDVDGDGDLDLLTPNYFSSTVSVRLNNGSGTFAGGQDLTMEDAPGSLVVGDIDADGDLDILVAYYGLGFVSVRLNNGRGIFTGTQRIPLGGTNYYALMIGDVDGDGDLDVVAPSYGSTASVRLNDGTGNFSGTQEIATNGPALDGALADVDGDGDLDLLTCNIVSNTVSVRLNTGNGTFDGGSEVALSSSPSNLVVGDVDGDGDLDILVSNASYRVTVRLNQAGSGSPPAPLAIYRLNTGGNALSTSQGAFAADQYFSSNSSVVSVNFPPIGTTNPALYRTVRNSTAGVLSYNLSVPNGSYTVVLHFAELTLQNVGQRVFDVSAEGALVLDNYDIFRKVGLRAATTETIAVTVTDGVLTLDLSALPATGGVGQASLAALEVLPVTPTYRLNAGGPALNTTRGAFAADQFFSAGSRTTTTSLSIAGTTDPALYQTERFSTDGVLSYAVPVANGSYLVTLHFAEFYWTQAGQRVFNIDLEGTTVRTNYDIVAKVGPRTATTEVFTATVTDGVLNLDLRVPYFSGGADQAKLSALELLPVAPVQRLNAGGPALNTSQGPFSADQLFTAGSRTTTTTAPITGTPDPALYQTERFSTDGVLSYAVPVANGTYAVTLHFAEFYWTQAGQRVFNIELEGAVARTNYDIVAQAGPRAATTETFQVQVTDGVLNLDLRVPYFSGGADQAKLSALEIFTVGASSNRPTLATVRAGATSALGVYPNPNTGRFSFTYSAKTAQEATLQLSDRLGRVVLQQMVPLRTGANEVQVVPPPLEAGLYQLLLCTPDGQRYSQKVMIRP